MYKLADGSSSRYYKKGDRFIVVPDSDGVCFKAGSIVELETNDYTECPYFTLVSGSAKWEKAPFEEWKYLKPLDTRHTGSGVKLAPVNTTALVHAFAKDLGVSLSEYTLRVSEDGSGHFTLVFIGTNL